MQHLEICLSTDYIYRQLKLFFFQLTKFFKLSCSCTDAAKRNTMYRCQGSFLFFKTESFIWLFVEESVAKGLIDGCVFDNLMQTFTADHRKIFQNFNFLTSRDLSLLPQNIAVIKTLLLFEAGLFFFGFSVEERHATGFNERESIPKRHF